MLFCVVLLIQQLTMGRVLDKSGFLEHLLSKTGLFKKVFFRIFAGLEEKDEWEFSEMEFRSD